MKYLGLFVEMDGKEEDTGSLKREQIEAKLEEA